MFKIALFLILSLGAFANDLSIVKGEIKAHTEVLEIVKLILKQLILKVY